jgi:AcrR family transcriptional regulator
MAVDEGTKERLLLEAQALYLEGGLPAFSLREVARRVGVSPAAVYRHYESREALLDAVCRMGFVAFGSYLVRALSSRTPLDRLRESGRMYLAFALERPRDYRVIFMGGAEGFAKPVAGGPEGSATFQFLVDRVRECMDTKVLARADETEVASMIWAFVHGLASLRLTGGMSRVGGDREFSRFYGRAVDKFLAGLAPRR